MIIYKLASKLKNTLGIYYTCTTIAETIAPQHRHFEPIIKGQQRPFSSINQPIDWYIRDLVPQHNDVYPGLNITILGSFKAWDAIKATRERFKELGCWVLGPHGEEVASYAGASGTFEVLDGDGPTVALFEERSGTRLTKFGTAAILEGLFLRAIQASDACYVVGLEKGDISDGYYVGTQVAGELGFALHCPSGVFGAPISPSLDEREGFGTMWDAYSHLIQPATPEETVNMLRSKAA